MEEMSFEPRMHLIQLHNEILCRQRVFGMFNVQKEHLQIAPESRKRHSGAEVVHHRPKRQAFSLQHSVMTDCCLVGQVADCSIPYTEIQTWA